MPLTSHPIQGSQTDDEDEKATDQAKAEEPAVKKSRAKAKDDRADDADRD